MLKGGDLIEDWKDFLLMAIGAFFGFSAFVGLHFIPIVGPLILGVLDLIGAPGWWGVAPFIAVGGAGTVLLRKWK